MADAFALWLCYDSGVFCYVFTATSPKTTFSSITNSTCVNIISLSHNYASPEAGGGKRRPPTPFVNLHYAVFLRRNFIFSPATTTIADNTATKLESPVPGFVSGSVVSGSVGFSVSV